MTFRRVFLAVVLVVIAVGAILFFAGDETAEEAPSAPASVATTVVGAAPGSTEAVTAPPSSTADPGGAALAAPPLPQPPPSPPLPGVAAGFEGPGLVTVAAGGADAAAAAGGRPFARIREGVVMGSLETADGWIKVVTSCDTVAWLPEAQVRAELPAPPLVPGTGADFAEAVLVIDPGHGGANNQGAPSPDGELIEKEVNLDIAHRVRDLLGTPHDVDWDTGMISDGDAVPAANRVVVTRSGDAAAADYEAGLIFRAAMANAAQAHALVSIHNNAGFDSSSTTAASDVYYQSDVPESRRLAAILAGEFQVSFAGFEADWVATLPVGAKSRLSPSDGEKQYYGILRRTEVPAVIAEGAYIANQSEADLLATPEFRQAYADAVYRALVRFITTADEGGPSYDPVVWEGNAGSGGARPECVLPEQPAP